MSDSEETKDKKKKAEPHAKSIDPAALEMIAKADAAGISTVFSRVDEMKACPIGAAGSCCQLCAMGPCRLVGKNAEENRHLRRHPRHHRRPLHGSRDRRRCGCPLRSRA